MVFITVLRSHACKPQQLWFFKRSFHRSLRMSCNIKLTVTPNECQHDEPVNIQIDGLQPKQSVTIAALTRNAKNIEFYSHSHYNANAEGKVDISSMPSAGGSYSGVFPMGLVSSLIAAPHHNKFSRYFKLDVETPTELKIQVHNGHISGEEIFNKDNNKNILSSCDHTRHYMAPGVTRIPIKHDVVRGALFIPPGPGPFPGVIDMFGSAGGLLDVRAAQLAGKGFVTLALPFFAYDDLPVDMENFDISYFEEAVQYLLAQEQVIKPNVGVIGVSKGADLALAMATFIPEVTACVAINGCISSVTSTLKVHDKVIKGLKFDMSKLKIIDEEVIDCLGAMMNPLDHPDTIIPLEQADAQLLFVVGGDDKNWNSSEYLQMAVDRLKGAGKSNFQVLYYPKAGHLIEPPYSPLCTAAFHKVAGAAILFGGELEGHTHAQVDSWQKVIRFFRRNITHYRSHKL